MKMRKARRTVQLEPNDSYVVASMEFWEHVVLTYETIAEDLTPEERQMWEEAAASVAQQAEENVYR
jgi:hypothetical protein